MSSSQSLMAAALEHAEHKFSSALEQLNTIAKLNFTAIEACLDSFDHNDALEAGYAPEAIARGIASWALLGRELILLTLSLEDANAAAERLAVE